MKKIILFALLAFLAACSDDDNPVQSYPEKRLVIITDYEKGSSFAITMMGSIESQFPNTKIEFITAPSFDLYEGAYLLEKAVEQYPAGTYFLTVVGSGVDNRVVAFELNGDRFICPDNGVASRVVNGKEVDFYYLDNLSITGGTWDEIPYFDFYRNSTLALLDDIKISNFGSKATSPAMLTVEEAKIKNQTISGQVLFRDNFGNCATNIPPAFMGQIFNIGDIIRVEYEGNEFFMRYGTYYNSVEVNENVCFNNSGNMIEMAINYGNFSERYSITAGSIIKFSKANIRIAFLMYNNSSVATDIYNGVLARMDTLGYKVGENLETLHGSAEGKAQNFSGLIKGMLEEEPDLFIAISTPASQAAASLVPEDIPLIFTYVTDPESAGLMEMRKNISGVSDKTNFSQFLDFVAEMLPNLNKAGNIYSSQEANSTFAKSKLEFHSTYYNFNIIYEDATSTDMLAGAYASLKGDGAEAILIAANNTASQGMQSLRDICIADKMPLIGDSQDHAVDGALASISVDYDKLASGTGDMIAATILGKPLDGQQIMYFKTDLIALNNATAEAIGFTFPQDILAKAKYVYE